MTSNHQLVNQPAAYMSSEKFPETHPSHTGKIPARAQGKP